MLHNTKKQFVGSVVDPLMDPGFTNSSGKNRPSEGGTNIPSLEQNTCLLRGFLWTSLIEGSVCWLIRLMLCTDFSCIFFVQLIDWNNQRNVPAVVLTYEQDNRSDDSSFTVFTSFLSTYHKTREISWKELRSIIFRRVRTRQAVPRTDHPRPSLKTFMTKARFGSSDGIVHEWVESCFIELIMYQPVKQHNATQFPFMVNFECGNRFFRLMHRTKSDELLTQKGSESLHWKLYRWRTSIRVESISAKTAILNLSPTKP